MAEQYPTLSEAHERPSLPRSAWSLDSIDLYSIRPSKQRKPTQRIDRSLEQCIPQSSYQLRQSKTSISTQPTSQYHFEQPRTGHHRKSRHTHQHSPNQEAMQDSYFLPVLSRDRTRWGESREIMPKGHKRSRCHERNSRGSHSNRRRSKKKHRDQQLLAPSYTIMQWLLWKLFCGG
jgi:hypothetical protein